MLNFYFHKKSNGVPILSKKEIEEYAEAIIKDYNPAFIKEPTPFNIDYFAEFYLGLNMDYVDLSNDHSIIGMMVFNDCFIPIYDAQNNNKKYIPVKEGTIIIDNSLLAENYLRRGRFTIGHESSHWILHRQIYNYTKDQICINFGDKQSTIKCLNRDVEDIAQKKSFLTDIDWIEWQADYMSSALLMPKCPFDMAVQQVLKKSGIKQGYIIKGMDHDLDIFIYNLTTLLADTFDVSIKAASIRLEKLGYIREKSLSQQLSLL